MFSCKINLWKNPSKSFRDIDLQKQFEETTWKKTIETDMDTLQGTNISPKNGILKMIFLFPRWDMLIPWRVYIPGSHFLPHPPETSQPWRPVTSLFDIFVRSPRDWLQKLWSMSTKLSHCLRSRSYTFSTDRCRTDQRMRGTVTLSLHLWEENCHWKLAGFGHREIHLLGISLKKIQHHESDLWKNKACTGYVCIWTWMNVHFSIFLFLSREWSDKKNIQKPRR